MKRFLSLLSLLLFAAPAFCASPSVLITVSDFTLDYAASNRVVRLSPTAAAGGTARRGLSDSSGQVTFTSVSPGLWTLTIENVGVPALSLRVPSSSDTLSASALVVSQWTAPVATALAASKAVVTASDKSLTSSATTATELGYVSGVTSALQTQIDAKQAALTATSSITGSNAMLNGWIKLQGQTNRIGDNGTALTYNGTAVGGGGDTVWTNDVNVLRNFDQTKNTAYSDYNNGWIVLSAEPSTVTPTFSPGKIEVVAIGDLQRLNGAPQLISTLDPYNVYDVVMIGDSPLGSATNVYQVVAIGNGTMDLAPIVVNSVGIGLGGSEAGPIYNCVFVGANANGGSSTNAITNRVSIGYSASCTNDNTIVLGNEDIIAVKSAGTFTSPSGFSSTDTTAAVNIASTGWTNTLGKLTRVFFNGTAMTFTVKDSGGTPFYTNAVALTGSDMILLQGSEAITISGTGVAGVRKPL